MRLAVSQSVPTLKIYPTREDIGTRTASSAGVVRVRILMGSNREGGYPTLPGIITLCTRAKFDVIIIISSVEVDIIASLNLKSLSGSYYYAFEN